MVEENDFFCIWYGYCGCLNQIMLGLMVFDYLECEVFCCGFEFFMQVVCDMLIVFGFDMDYYYQESFGVLVCKELEVLVLDDVVLDDDVGVQIIFVILGVIVKCIEIDIVLVVVKVNGLNILLGCIFGLCGICKIRKILGEVYMVYNGGIIDDDIVDGYIFVCCLNFIGLVLVEV